MDWKKYEESVEVGPYYVDGIGYVEGWKVFKKVGKFLKKVGKGIKHLKIKSVLKIAIPIVGLIGLAPVAGFGLAALAKKFGPKAAGLIKGGSTVLRAVKGADGKARAALLPARLAKFIPSTSTLTEAMLSKLTGKPAADSILSNSEISPAGEAIIPAGESAPASGAGNMAKLLIPAAAIGGLLLWASKKKR